MESTGERWSRAFPIDQRASLKGDIMENLRRSLKILLKMIIDIVFLLFLKSFIHNIKPK